MKVVAKSVWRKLDKALPVKVPNLENDYQLPLPRSGGKNNRFPINLRHFRFNKFKIIFVVSWVYISLWFDSEREHCILGQFPLKKSLNKTIPSLLW